MKIVIAIFLLLCIMTGKSQFIQKKIKRDYVPNDSTAIKIAEAIWFPIYGFEVLEEKPYVVSLRNDSIWVVEGTLHSEFGGVAYIEINKSNCKILKVTHGK